MRSSAIPLSAKPRDGASPAWAMTISSSGLTTAPWVGQKPHHSMPFWWRLAGPMFRRLKQQLALGGRLVIPVGSERREQKLLKISRRSETEFEQEDLGEVLFVPLVGQQGWAEDGRRAASNHVPGRSRGRTLPEMIAAAAEPLPDFLDPAFAQLFDRYAARRVVLLGEATHGTAEFYRARAAITRHLLSNHGFTLLAVEADWPPPSSIVTSGTDPRGLAASRRSSASPPGCGATPKLRHSSIGCGHTTSE